MKKFSFVSAALFFAALISFTGCASLTNTSSGTAVSTTTTVKLYDNCPQDTYALAAELALRATNSSYKGITTFSFTGTPNTSNVGPVATYYGYCLGIKEAIAKGNGKACTLSFNTSANGTGTALDFSNANAIVKSLLSMALYNNIRLCNL